jgi:hypothetical protein
MSTKPGYNTGTTQANITAPQGNLADPNLQQPGVATNQKGGYWFSKVMGPSGMQATNVDNVPVNQQPAVGTINYQSGNVNNL